RLVIRPVRLAEFSREVERLQEIYCSAWEHNWGFVPPTREEFLRIARELKPIFDERCAVCAEADGRMIACAIGVPDVNQALRGTGGRLFPLGLPKLLVPRRSTDQPRLLLLGVAPRSPARGRYALLCFAPHPQLIG